MQSKLLFTMIALLIFGGLNAQKSSDIDLAKRTLAADYEKYGLNLEEIEEYLVSDHYVSTYHMATHLYLWQTYNGIPVYNGLITVGIQNDKIYNIQSNAVKNLPIKIAGNALVLSPEQAIKAAGELLGYPNNEEFTRLSSDRENSFLYEATSFSRNDIPVYLCYDKSAKGDYVLSWYVDLDIPGSDYYSVRVNATDGSLVSKNNFTVYCSFEEDVNHTHTHACHSHVQTEGSNETNSALVKQMMMGGTYRVYAAPAESPKHGEHELVVDPADPIASPFGWHDTDGVEGAETTITHGNNVKAYLDKDADDISDGNEPDGGADLVFDFPHDQSGEPEVSEQAAQVNLFYMNNFIHDFTYRYGFDEAAGNFQTNNYGNGGQEFDQVEAQSADGSGTNNANFATPQDGFSGRMQMFLWGGSEFDLFKINEPSEIEGPYEVRAAQFGGPITDDPVTGELVVVQDGTPSPSLGCEELVNTDEVNGKIAMIDRGECEFGLKSLNAQNAGAIGVIVCNIAGVNGGDGNTDIFNMAGGDFGAQVTIPVIMMGLDNCNSIKASVNAGVTVEGTIQLPQVTGPEQLDASFDNGVIAHEFGHGVSNRLTGGPSQAGCLTNDEQMGEGWSDFFTLVTSVEPGDAGTDARGIGTYVSGEDVDGRGIRDFPYSTDMEISPKTYNDIIGTGAPHPLGEVWAAVTWDIYWAMVDVYGYDADINNLESGNAKAIRIVIEGMKEQDCSPGFLSGRDGLLAADEALYDGENFCLIYDAFARRGMGYQANQGSTDDRGDGVEGYLSHPSCLDTLLLTKNADQFVKIGDEFEVQISLQNFRKGDVDEVVVVDEIPSGTSYVEGSATVDATVTGNVITFNVGAMEPEALLEFTYRLKAEEGAESKTYFLDDFADGEDRWDIDIFEGDVLSWELVDDALEPDNEGFRIGSTATESDNVLFSLGSYKIAGDRPTLKFSHRYNSEAGADGGFVSVRPKGDLGWTRLNADNNVRNGYNFTLAYGTFALPNLSAFSGNSNGVQETFLDLSDYVGQEIEIRFRYGTDAEDVADGEFVGWAIDDFEIMDLKDFMGTACVEVNGEQANCAGAITLIESDGVVGINEIERDDFGMSLFPNPTSGTVNVSIVSNESSDARLEIIAVDGTSVRLQEIRLGGKDLITVQLDDIASGVYFVKLTSDSKQSIKRLIVE